MTTTTFLGGVKLSYDEEHDIIMLGQVVMTGDLFRQFTALPDWSCLLTIENGKRVITMSRSDHDVLPVARRVEIAG